MTPAEQAERAEMERQRDEDTARWGDEPAPARDARADAWAAAIAHRAWGIGGYAEQHVKELRAGGDGRQARAVLLAALSQLQRMLAYAP